MSDLLMIVPTRGRPSKLDELLDSWEQTTIDATLLIVIDNDDAELDAYRTVFDSHKTRQAYLIDIQRERLGPTLNTCSRVYADDFLAMGFLGDDHRPRTHGWDQEFVSALTELKTGFVYGNDLLQGGALPTAIAMTSDIVRTLGWMVPPGLIHLYIDNAWLDLGRMCGCIKYLPHVVIEHMHPAAGKAPSDAGYIEVNSAEMYRVDGETYQSWCQSSRTEAAQRIIELREACA